MRPALSLSNRQRVRPFDTTFILRFVTFARPACMAAVRLPAAPLCHLLEVEATILSDRAIGRVHDEFFSDPEPTDVITFHHGEILVSADTALRQGSEHGQALNHELALYMIHGLMHLGGWDDHEAEEAAEMAQRQQVVLESCLG